jgi:NADH-quinone oxidoreductase subunit C
MDAAALANALRTYLPDGGVEPIEALDEPTVVVPADQLVAVALALRDRPEFRFVLAVDIVGVDVLPREPRFEINYHLVSPDRDQPLRVRLKVRVSGVDPHVPSLADVWPSCNFLEREVWDLLGVVFDGHPDLRRLLMPDEWEGHPLRKDYPVQIALPVATEEPVQLTPEQFRANIQQDRESRKGSHT